MERGGWKRPLQADLGLEHKVSMSLGKEMRPKHGCSAAAAVELNLGAAGVSVVPVDQTAPSNRYLLKCQSYLEKVRSLGTRSSREMTAGVELADHSQIAVVKRAWYFPREKIR